MDLLLDLVRRRPLRTGKHAQPECDILCDGHMPEQRVMLEHESYATVGDPLIRYLDRHAGEFVLGRASPVPPEFSAGWSCRNRRGRGAR